MSRRPRGSRVLACGRRRNTGARRIVNEAGALTFNGLNTRDLKARRRFYGAVFGWATFDLPGGKVWTLPAYGDYLEELTPGTRARTAEFGVPGFEDVVAAINPIRADDTARPPTGASPSAPTTPTPPLREPPISAARSSSRRSTRPT